jgi:hypothetical protein
VRNPQVDEDGGEGERGDEDGRDPRGRCRAARGELRPDRAYRERGPVRQQRQKRSKGEKIRRIMPAIHVGCRPEEHPLRAKVSLHIERLSGVSAENLRPGNPDLGEVSA